MVEIIDYVPYGIISSGFFVTIVTGYPLGAIFSSSLLLSGLFNYMLKEIFAYFFHGDDLIMRPKGNKTTNCDELSVIETNDLGMPSGHAQIMAFSAIFWTLYILKYSEIPYDQKVLFIMIIFFLTLIVLFQRVETNCHSVLQVAIGCLVGFLSGWLVFVLLDKNYSYLFTHT
ncbi:MAG: dolichyldiphosphatase [Harvfovirus sp.]|uniref:Dolichyldiphosphatase n=1 Tax=Harvfovirus sp. TaxID=2487768 RepID=A0A3G5A3V1_9VIRU|nr:MAG: dolichyldiphosphatase [Harvfovirus sp.]